MKRFVHALIIVLTLIVGVTAAVIVVTQTAWFKNWLRGYVVREANRFLNGQVSIQRLGGNLFFGIEMEERRHLVERQRSRVRQGSRSRLQHLRAPLEGTVRRRHQAQSADAVPAPRRRHLVDRAADQEAGKRSRSAGPRLPDRHRRDRDQQRVDRGRRSSRNLGIRRAGSHRSPRCATVLRVSAGALLGRDQPRVVQGDGSGGRPQQLVRRHRRPRRHGIPGAHCAADRRELRPGGGRHPALFDEADPQPADLVRQTVDSGNRESVAGARGRAAAAGVRAEDGGPGGGARRRDEREVVGRRRGGEVCRGRRDARPVCSGHPVGAPPESRTDCERRPATNRSDGGRASGYPRASLLESGIDARHRLGERAAPRRFRLQRAERQGGCAS